MTRRVRVALKAAVWAVCLYPVALLLYQFQTDNLGANPIEHVTRTLGIWTLRILLASLAMTPLRILFGIAWPIAFRRLLGLFAFFSVCLHFSVWIVLDHFFDWPRMGADILKRPYITVGLLALTLLAPLAATSTAGMVKRLGGLAWQRLHRLVYVAGVLGALHFLWLAKKGRDEPFVYAGVLAILLGVRLVDWARRAVKRRWAAVPASESARAARRGVLALFIVLAIGLAGWLAWPAAGQALRRGQPAPEIAGSPWINSPPLTSSGLKGRVVLVEFWTYG
ncbi:MAG: ferric reductase-like transmembrane domain-containing protein [Candidatus Rokubacteria bacterium]|nr:ferric reductase-like transmembrane domain-containing protein [Candidatus Rokubacteria bacterium]